MMMYISPVTTIYMKCITYIVDLNILTQLGKRGRRYLPFGVFPAPTTRLASRNESSLCDQIPGSTMQHGQASYCSAGIGTLMSNLEFSAAGLPNLCNGMVIFSWEAADKLIDIHSAKYLRIWRLFSVLKSAKHSLYDSAFSSYRKINWGPRQVRGATQGLFQEHWILPIYL